MWMIIGLIWITISSPIWIILTTLYLVFKYFLFIFLFLVGVVVNIIAVIFGVKTIGESLGFLSLKFLEYIFKLFASTNDLFLKFWEFGRYDHPYWALIISLLLLFIYFKLLDILR